MKKVENSHRNMNQIFPSSAKWIKDGAEKFEPENNTVITSNGDKIEYDLLIVAMGLQLNYKKIPGLYEALEIENSGVCSNYSAKYVERTFKTLKNFKEGNAIFTFPNTPVKCPGAPQKACYISENYLRKVGKRDKATFYYNTSLPVIFGVKHYADALWPVCKARDINVNLRTNLIEVIPEKKQAIFENLDNPGEKKTFDYEMLHVAPPMSTPEVLQKSPIVDGNGFVAVNKDTLQHVKYPNIFAIGDNSNSPNSKTAASAAAQSPVVLHNGLAVLNGKKLEKIYNGYASCPLVTGYNTAILAEFDYNLQPFETFPIPQNKERYTMFLMKKYFMSPLYWQLMMRGYWDGPLAMRKIFNIFRFK